MLSLPLATNTLVYAFGHSDYFARFIVVMLFAVSMYVWTIMVDKGVNIRRARQGSRKFLRAFQETRAPLLLDIRQYEGPVSEVYRAGIEEVQRIAGINASLAELDVRRRQLPRALVPNEVDKVRSTLERTVTAQVMMLEDRLGLLSTAVSVSPFLGLLGTVWGVMAAFAGMAQAGRPDITAMAPGISGALLTTVIGLVVAIPALVGYNLLANAVNRTTVEMDTVTEDFIAALRLEQGEPVTRTVGE